MWLDDQQRFVGKQTHPNSQEKYWMILTSGVILNAVKNLAIKKGSIELRSGADSSLRSE
jgi:hypothetical protein